MAKTEPKGQRVKTFKHWIPQPDLSKVEVQVVVYFKADEGRFYIYEGQHMIEALGDVIGKHYTERDDIRTHRGSINSRVMDDAIKALSHIGSLYETLLRESNKVRVIRFSFARNRPYVEGSPHKPQQDISFTGAPALHFDYDILWRVHDKLYRQDTPRSPLQFAGSVARSRGLHGETETCVDWTPEREAFFATMRLGLVTLINRIEDFQSDLAGNIDLAIASGGGPLMLAPPTKEEK